MISLEISNNEVVSFLSQSNKYQIINTLIINNKSGNILENLTVKIKSNPNFLEEYIFKIDYINKDNSFQIDFEKKPLILSQTFLMNLNESVIGNYSIIILKDAEKIYEGFYSVELLAPNQWLGNLYPNEIIVSFVQPNNNKVSNVITKAAELLQRGGGSFSAYQTASKENVTKQIESIYLTLHQENIFYTVAPANFEKHGQKIRWPNIVLEQKQGNCLDLSILLSSCLEAVGLNPFFVFFDNHVYVGCWLTDTGFPNVVEDDISIINKNTSENMLGLILIESTSLTSEKLITLKDSHDNALNQLKIKDFQYIIDIRWARNLGIKPLPILQEQLVETGEVDELSSINEKLTFKIDVQQDLNFKTGDSEGQNKIDLWRSKLLNLTARNNFINFKPKKNTIQVLHHSLEELEDIIVKERELQVTAKPDSIKVYIKNKFEYLKDDYSLFKDLINNELNSNRLLTFESQLEIQNKLKFLSREAKSFIEENGSNALYLTFGLLKWYENDVSERDYFAPIFLIPIEIVKKSSIKGYVIRKLDEEAFVNITLLEKFRQELNIDISIFEKLSLEANEVNLQKLLLTFRKIIKEKPRWDIIESAYIEIFTFNQFVMWEDLNKREEEIVSHKIVKSIVNQKLDERIDKRVINPYEVDEQSLVEDTAVLLPTDSSQLSAVVAAKNNQSFVLHGPPGTGKSQTISNIITTALFQGKSVLFVAEKMAALEVVKKRLDNIGVGKFSLELHSNKAKKGDVLKQFSESLALPFQGKVLDYYQESEKLASYRKELQNITNELHLKNETGYSIYEMIEEYVKVKDVKYRYTVSAKASKEFNRANVENTVKMLKRYLEFFKICSPINSHYFKNINKAKIKYLEKMEFFNLSEKLLKKMTIFKGKYNKFLNNNLNLFKSINSTENIKLIIRLFKCLCEIDDIHIGFFGLNKENKIEYETLFKNINILRNKETELSEIFQLDILNEDVIQVHKNWRLAEQTWLIPKLFQKNSVRNLISIYTLNNKKIKLEETAIYLKLLVDFIKFSEEVDNHYDNLKVSLPKENLKTIDTKKYLNLLNNTIELKYILNKIENTTLGLFISVIPNFSHWKKTNYDVLQNLVMEFNEITNILYNINDIIDFDMLNFTSNDWLYDITNLLKGWLNNKQLFDDWLLYIEEKQKFTNEEIIEIIKNLEIDKIKSINLIEAYKKSLFEFKIYTYIEKNEVLSKFNNQNITMMIKTFNDQLNKFKDYTREELRARLSSNLPKSHLEGEPESELIKIKKAIQNNARGISLRKLFDETQYIVRRIFPCMLMSPISVAQYLSPNFPKFDYIIFDEASQVTTYNSVGVISRGKELIIAGDDKQLPPTTFFQRQFDDEGVSFDQRDSNSILEEMLTIGVPKYKLSWHYRSRHESLITYSNKEYYKNELYTFPSINDKNSKVKFVQLSGVYDKGKTRTTVAEAKYIVNEIERRVLDPVLRKMSIGVITFNQTQQKLIERILDERFIENPKFEESIKRLPEELIIKNLENIQGDERDVILISITYGKDKDNKISMNFGPLNKVNGEKRLNVAISRAKEEMIVCAILRPEDIDLRRTSNVGIKNLKEFLTYARNGKLNVNDIQSESAKLDNLIIVVAERLREKGYEVQENIGHSRFKIDIGIVDKNNPDNYELGIIIDGKKYSEIPSVNDKTIVQYSVLKGLGWKLFNLWSIEWFKNEERVLNQIIDILNLNEKEKNKGEIFKTKTSSYKIEYTKEMTINIPYDAIKLEIHDIGYNAIYSGFYNKLILERLIDIINHESPITNKLCYKRLVASFSRSQVTKKLVKYLSGILNQAHKFGYNIYIQESSRETVFWKNHNYYNNYNLYRYNTGSEFRAINEIPLKEISNVIINLLENYGSINSQETNLELAVVKNFGFLKTGNLSKEHIRLAIKELINDNKIEHVNGMYQIK